MEFLIPKVAQKEAEMKNNMQKKGQKKMVSCKYAEAISEG